MEYMKLQGEIGRDKGQVHMTNTQAPIHVNRYLWGLEGTK